MWNELCFYFLFKVDPIVTQFDFILLVVRDENIKGDNIFVKRYNKSLIKR